MYVIVAGIDAGQPEVLGPFYTRADAEEWARARIGAEGEADWLALAVLRPLKPDTRNRRK